MAAHSNHGPKVSLPASKPVLGLVGGIGSGKSRVADEFVKLGGRLISGDHLGHQALIDPDIKEQVVAYFGSGILNPQGNIDRRKLGKIVFADPDKLKALEQRVFPFIESNIREEIRLAQADARVPFVVLDAAIMLETGWHVVCDKLIFVDTPRQVRLERLLSSRGWQESEVNAREKHQIDPAQKKQRADFVVDNGADAPPLASQVHTILGSLGLGKLPLPDRHMLS